MFVYAHVCTNIHTDVCVHTYAYIAVAAECDMCRAKTSLDGGTRLLTAFVVAFRNLVAEIGFRIGP